MPEKPSLLTELKGIDKKEPKDKPAKSKEGKLKVRELSEIEKEELGKVLRQAVVAEKEGNYRLALQLYQQYDRGIRETSELSTEIEQRIQELNKKYQARAREIETETSESGLATKFSEILQTPELPPDFTAEHLETMNEVFGEGNLELTTTPSPETLTEQYFQVMYPEKQREKDTEQGLTSYRPSHWDSSASADKIGGDGTETWGQAYIRSMRQQAEGLQSKTVLSETIQKPKYIDGRQQYGTIEGTDATKDKLLPIIQEVFGEEKNRFELSYDQIEKELIPTIKAKITEELTSKGLEIPSFEVIATPAILANQLTTLEYPSDSQTNTYDWSSTPLYKQDKTESGSLLIVGDSDDGGASCVNDRARDGQWNFRGVRFSVVLST